MTLANYNNHTSSSSGGNNPPPSVPTADAVLAQPATEPEINVNAASSTAGAGYNSSKQDQFAYAYAAEAQIINDVPGVPASSQIVLVGEQVPSSSAPTSTSNPPGNCPDGGQWGVMEYVGNKTTALACLGCLCFGLFGLCLLACPQDEKDAYRVNGKLYDAEGTLIGPVSRYKFTPTRGPRGGSGLRRT